MVTYAFWLWTKLSLRTHAHYRLKWLFVVEETYNAFLLQTDGRAGGQVVKDAVLAPGTPPFVNSPRMTARLYSVLSGIPIHYCCFRRFMKTCLFVNNGCDASGPHWSGSGWFTVARRRRGGVACLPTSPTPTTPQGTWHAASFATCGTWLRGTALACGGSNKTDGVLATCPCGMRHLHSAI